MNIGKAQILTCPHCGGKKEVMSLLSGNTFDQTLWSDNKSIVPMMPRVSFIQKCPECGKYFMMSRQTAVEYGDDSSWNLGNLSFAELKEAWEQLSAMTDLTDDEKLSGLIMQVWAFNDEYTRNVQKDIPQSERDYFTSIVKQLVAMESVDDLLKADLLRETGEFDKAMEILDAYQSANKFMEEIKVQFVEATKARLTAPILIMGDDDPII